MEVTHAELAAEPLLGVADERALAEQIEAGLFARQARLLGERPLDATGAELILIEQQGEQARQRYIRANLRLVSMVSHREARRSRMSETELFQEGCVGLITAVERFDHRRGNRFATYALFWIRAYVSAATANRFGELNLPISRAERLRQVQGIQAELAQVLGRSPALEEIAERVGRGQEWLADLLAHQAPQSIESEGGWAYQVVDPTAQDRFEAVLGDQLNADDLLWHLTGPQRRVVELRFGFVDGVAWSYAEIGRMLRLSVPTVRRREQQGLEILRSVCPQQASVLL